MTNSLLEILVKTLEHEQSLSDPLTDQFPQRLFILALDLFLILDPQGNCLKVNCADEQICGITPSQLKTKNLVDLIEPSDQTLFISALNQAKQTEQLTPVFCRFFCENNENKWFLFNLKFVPNQQVIYAIARDITEEQNAQINLEKRVKERTLELEKTNQLLQQEINERKKTELALRESEQRLTEKAQELEKTLNQLQHISLELLYAEKIFSLGQVVAGIATEINTPINFIYGNLEYLSHHIQDLMRLLDLYRRLYPRPYLEIQDLIKEIDIDFILDDLPHVLNSMKSGAEKIHKMVFSLRNFAHHQQTEQKLIHLDQHLDSVIQMLNHRLMASDNRPFINIIKHYQTLPPVECYVGQLNQVLINILNNAIDAIEEETNPAKNPTITLSLELISPSNNFDDPHNQVVIKIKDNGIGIKPEIQSKIFDPFFTTKAVGKGTGLGLAVTYQIIVEQHHGEIDFISEPEKGSEFIITLPVKQINSHW